MKTLLATAFVAAFSVTLACGSAATAAPLQVNKQHLTLKGDALKKIEMSKLPVPSKKGFSITVGEAFYPNQKEVDVRGECLAAGRTPKRRFEGNGFVWVCLK